jgi:hypothetical protein
MLTLRDRNRDRPVNMALLDFPHKKNAVNPFDFRNKKPESEIDKYNKTVKEMRVHMNKLSKDNYEVIEYAILDYSLSPSLLNELMKIIFAKSTTESTYLQLYVKLCMQLFDKYNDKEN